MRRKMMVALLRTALSRAFAACYNRENKKKNRQKNK